MTLRIGSQAPDFTADTTQGRINFHEWLGDSWGILFSHPKDFTPVCTTELGYLAKLEPEFTKRNTKIIGLSVDPVDDHGRWLEDVERHGGAKVNYPIIADHDLTVSKLYNMLPEEEAGSSQGRTAATNATVRTVYMIGPDKLIKAMLIYPMSSGRNFDEVLRLLDFDPAHRQAQGGDPGELEAGRGLHHRPVGVGRGSPRPIPGRLDQRPALPAPRAAAGPRGGAGPDHPGATAGLKSRCRAARPVEICRVVVDRLAD